MDYVVLNNWIPIVTIQNKDARSKMNRKMLLRPVDFALLDELTEGRNVAANLHMEIDSNRSYVNQRLSTLADYGLIDRVGPSESAGLYEITPLGRAALEHRKEYGEVDDFEALIEDAVNE